MAFGEIAPVVGAEQPLRLPRLGGLGYLGQVGGEGSADPTLEGR
jgi:hypothetical protein